MTTSKIPPREVRVTVRKQVSDGNYGTEAVEVTLQEWLTDEYDVDEDDLVAASLTMRARRMVQTELDRSPSFRVRQSIKQLGDPVAGQPRQGLQPVTSGAAPDDF